MIIKIIAINSMKNILDLYTRHLIPQVVLLNWNPYIENISALQLFNIFRFFWACQGILSHTEDITPIKISTIYDFDENPDIKYFSEEQIESLSADTARELVAWLNTHPSYGSHRILFMENIEKMPIICSNIFLKLIEEPPVTSWILCTTRAEHKILMTLRSRLILWRVSHIKKTIEAYIQEKKWTKDKIINKIVDKIFQTETIKISKKSIARVDNSEVQKEALKNMYKDLKNVVVGEDLTVLQNHINILHAVTEIKNLAHLYKTNDIATQFLINDLLG